MSNEPVIPTKEKLARAIEARRGKSHDPRVDRMIKLARAGHYDEFESDLAAPITALVMALREVGYTDLAERVIEGDYDATQEEGDAWMQKEGWDYLLGRKK